MVAKVLIVMGMIVVQVSVGSMVELDYGVPAMLCLCALTTALGIALWRRLVGQGARGVLFMLLTGSGSACVAIVLGEVFRKGVAAGVGELYK